MTFNDGFGRTVSDWLDEQAQGVAPAYLDEVLARTVRTNQRPAWSSLERWLPVQTTYRFAPVPRVAWLLVLLALIVALGTVVVLSGSRPRLPEPFGLARNGSIVYGGPDGDIHALDPVTGVSRVIVTGPTIDLAPSFSNDGSRVIFARQADVAGNLHTLVLAKADGTGLRPLTEPLANLTWYTWSPDGTRVAVLSDRQDRPALWVLSVDQMTKQNLDIGMDAEMVQWRPDGRELVFRGLTSGPGRPTSGLYVVGVDGTGPRAIVPPTDSDGHWQNPTLSPDGRQIIYTQWDDTGGRLWVVGVDGGTPRKLAFDGPLASEYYAHWSADGAQIVFHRWSGDDYRLAVAPAGGGHAVEIGPAMLQQSGAASAEFSPDGSHVIARYPDGSSWILGVADGSQDRIPTSSFLASWQRKAR